MNKKYLKENNLYEAHKQFMRLCEWQYTPIQEDDDDDNDNQQNQPMNDEMNGNQFGGEMQQDGNGMGQDMNQGMNEPNQMSQMDDDQQMQGGDSSLGQMNDNMPMNSDDIPQMGNEMANDEMPPIDDDSMDSNDTVIDVDDITNAQEKMNDKVNFVGKDLEKVTDKIDSLMKSIDNMQQMIDNNNAEIQEFKKEFEKRNPTQVEKLNLRSLDSYPFNVTPKEYWEKKGLDPNSNYSAYGDNDENTTQEYRITNNDVDDFNEREIEDSFSITDDMEQNINKIFGF